MRIVEGTFADAEGIHPFTESLVDGGLDIYEGKPVVRPIRKARHEPETVTFDVEPIHKRAASERLAEATQRIYEEALHSYATFGKVVFPVSILADIQHQFWVAGEPITLEQIQALAEHEIRPLCERYAAQLLNIATNQNQAFLVPEVKGH